MKTYTISYAYAYHNMKMRESPSQTKLNKLAAIPNWVKLETRFGMVKHIWSKVRKDFLTFAFVWCYAFRKVDASNLLTELGKNIRTTL